MSQHIHVNIAKTLVKEHQDKVFIQYLTNIKDTQSLESVKDEIIPIAIETNGVIFNDILTLTVTSTPLLCKLIRSIDASQKEIQSPIEKSNIQTCLHEAISNLKNIDNKSITKECLMYFTRFARKDTFFLAHKKGMNFDLHEGFFIYCVLATSFSESLMLTASDIELLGYSIRSDRSKWLTRFARAYKEQYSDKRIEAVFTLLADLKALGLQGLSESSVKMLMKAMGINHPIDYLSTASNKESAIIMELMSQ